MIFLCLMFRFIDFWVITAVLVPIFVYLFVWLAYLLSKDPFIIVDLSQKGCSFLILKLFGEKNGVIYLFEDMDQTIFDSVFGIAITGYLIDGKATLRISLNYYWYLSNILVFIPMLSGFTNEMFLLLLTTPFFDNSIASNQYFSIIYTPRFKLSFLPEIKHEKLGRCLWIV